MILVCGLKRFQIRGVPVKIKPNRIFDISLTRKHNCTEYNKKINIGPNPSPAQDVSLLTRASVFSNTVLVNS